MCLSTTRALVMEPVTLSMVRGMSMMGSTARMGLIMANWAPMPTPERLTEAAMVDGAGHFRILFQIVLPVSKAIIAVIVLFYAIQHWNAWFNASIYLRDRQLFPLQLVLREIVLNSSENSIVADADANTVDIFRPLIKYCSIMVSIIPMMVIYPFVQKYFVTGVMIGSVKG